MKDLLSILLLMSLGCNNQGTQINNVPAKDSTEKLISKTDNSKYYTTKDSVKIRNNGDTITYSKEEFNQLIDEHPELLNLLPQDPDLLYYSVGNKEQFTSEVGQDEYYILYTYFLRKKNGEEKYNEARNTIISIYKNINLLYQHFQHGGTYFGHQNSRINGYAEYTVYEYSSANDYQKTYNLSKQKQLYIQSLRQLVADESSIDFETTRTEKQGRIKELNNIVDSLDTLITNIFYLRKAQAFQYSHYQYF